MSFSSWTNSSNSAESIPQDLSREVVTFEQRERLFLDKSVRIKNVLSETQSLVGNLNALTQSDWPFRYPKHISQQENLHTNALDSEKFMSPSRPRSNSLTPLANSVPETLKSKTFSTYPVKGSSSLDILNLDVKFGTHYNNAMDSLEQHSISNLFQERLSHCSRYLDKLVARVTDKSSKILVTGDLNSGKSTFVNALLKRKVMPIDQQPCTMLFCEVLATELNDNIEEAHAIPRASQYNIKDPNTYDRIELRHLPKTVAEDFKEYELVKVYCHDRQATETMLNNGTLDITLIDSPGLNRDSIKTTQLFARQEEIDVIVFVVHAENQFTLSGQEFLQSAGKEKAYIFIVVNRFDTIRDKNRCRRQILEQIRQLSPRTFEDAAELVHFVAAEDCFPYDGEQALPAVEIPTDFQKLEGSLRSFILEKRARSKLAPAKRFALNVLSDVKSIAKFNLEAANVKAQEISSKLDKILPQCELTLKDRDAAIVESNSIAKTAIEYARHEVERSLDLAISSLGKLTSFPAWPGIFGTMTYIENLKLSCLCTLRQQYSDSERRVADSALASYRSILSLDASYSKNESIPSCPINNQQLFKNDCFASIQFSWSELFDLNVKLRNISLGASAITFLASQAVGTHQFLLYAYQIFISPSEVSNLFMIAGGSFIGVSLLYIGSCDIQKACNEKVISKIQSELQSKKKAAEAGDSSSKNVNQYIQGATGRLYAVYSERIRDQEAQKNAHLDLQRVVGAAQKGYSSLIQDSRRLTSNRLCLKKS